ncbi:MAG: SusC/RagA family TonB-linked outer membrane protein, partial [Bacteroidales bacterium]|nr:SusC/RagA family TonB-linked outer membrane protein [Bacteroidales bacterium]
MKKNFVFKRSGAWRKIMSMLCILSVGSLVAFAQKQVSGSVTDAGGEPLAGASVMEKGTTNGSMTDIDGKFTLSNVGNNAVLQVSFVGFVTQETPVGNASTLKIILTEDMQALEEVVVIGYGTVRRQDYTGSVSSVKLENSAIATLPNLHILEALKGNVSGLNVGGISTAGGDADLLIRGQNSINGDNKPLIILDGMIFMGNMTDINPNDIANIDVLKDAVAAAAYGSRSANGVISISTKKGHTDKPVITFNASAGIHTWANNKPQLANGKDWLANTNAITGREADNVAFLLPEIQELVAQGKDRNMLNMIIHTGNLQDYQLAVSGTGKGINYYLSTSYEKSHGVFIGDTYNRISVLGKINTDISDWLNIGLDAGFSRRDYSGVSADFGGMMSGSPYFISIHEVDPATYTHWVTSPLWGIDDGFRDNIDFRHNFRLNTHATVSVPWIKGLSYRLSFLPNWDLTREGDFFYETYYQNTAPGPFTPEVLQSYLTRANGNRTNTRKYNYVWDNIITYKNYFGKHNVEATLVATRDYDKYDLEGMSGSDFS